MVTFDSKSNIGFDFDVNIRINDDEGKYSEKEIKNKIRLALNKVVCCYGYGNAEDSTRVLIIKIKDRKNSRILHSCDFAIVNDYIDDDVRERQEYIHFNKKRNTYSWEEQLQGFYLLDEKEECIKTNRYWQKVRDLYIGKKNYNTDYHKHTRSIYAETIHEICQKYGYYYTHFCKIKYQFHCLNIIPNKTEYPYNGLPKCNSSTAAVILYIPE